MGHSQFPYTQAGGPLCQRPGQGTAGAERGVRPSVLPSPGLALWGKQQPVPGPPKRNVASSHCLRVNKSKALGSLVPHQDTGPQGWLHKSTRDTRTAEPAPHCQGHPKARGEVQVTRRGFQGEKGVRNPGIRGLPHFTRWGWARGRPEG